ncbi:hypothetical protein CEXT_99511 [Caerostris extrusa]|uniref:Ribose-5-phosphate isomerase n=1 Tax=Caerostris extrusa TaxID=172846 RepID=A0AAV4XHZ6_CAEEX|nr:hypothetical protein CEXT_99511 [Caerostris extrusa]
MVKKVTTPYESSFYGAVSQVLKDRQKVYKTMAAFDFFVLLKTVYEGSLSCRRSLLWTVRSLKARGIYLGVLTLKVTSCCDENPLQLDSEGLAAADDLDFYLDGNDEIFLASFFG